jgi:hypothetical protein
MKLADIFCAKSDRVARNQEVNSKTKKAKKESPPLPKNNILLGSEKFQLFLVLMQMY